MSEDIETYPHKSFLRWEVKPIWKITYPSPGKIGSSDPEEFTLFGVDRGALDITRNWEKINSVEQFNQGFAAKPTDFVFTIAVKEKTPQFEKMRRLSKSGVYFDVECDVLRKASDLTHGDNQHGFGTETEAASTYVQWLDGFEQYIGCLVNREGSTVELGTIPIREFEIVFLEHAIKTSISGNFNTVSVSEGDGSFPTLDSLGISL